MRKLGPLAASAVIGVGALCSTDTQARDRGAAIAAGVIGGLAAGALVGAATSNAYAAPAYGYNYPAYGYEYDEPPPVVYRKRRVVRTYDYDEVPVYRTRRVVRSYSYRYAPAEYEYSWGGPGFYGY